MKSSLNYTGRIKLDYSKFALNVYEKEIGPSEIGLILHKSHVQGIRETAAIRLEAYRGPKTMQFNLGQWTQPTDEKRFALTDFSPGEPVYFRIKIVDEDDPKHPIRAWRDQIRPTEYDENGQKKKSALEVLPEDLHHIAWKIDWSEPSDPVLLVNSRISEAREVTSIVAQDPDFAALVFPQALREILTRLLRQMQEMGADAEESAPQNKWMIFASSLVGKWFEDVDGEETEDRNERIDVWVEDAVQAFGKELDLIARYKKFKLEEKP